MIFWRLLATFHSLEMARLNCLRKRVHTALDGLWLDVAAVPCRTSGTLDSFWFQLLQALKPEAIFIPRRRVTVARSHSSQYIGESGPSTHALIAH